MCPPHAVAFLFLESARIGVRLALDSVVQYLYGKMNSRAQCLFWCIISRFAAVIDDAVVLLEVFDDLFDSRILVHQMDAHSRSYGQRNAKLPSLQPMAMCFIVAML